MRVEKSKLLKFIRENGPVTFQDIERYFKKSKVDFMGDTALKLSNIVVWSGWSYKTARAFFELYDECKISIIDSPGAPPPPPRHGEKEITYRWRPVVIQAEKEVKNGNYL